MRKQMPFWCCFKEKSKKFAWGQPESQCGLLYQFSGKLIFLNLPCYWWGIHEMWEENQRLCIKQQQHVSIWLILSKPLILFLWWPKEPQLYESYSCCETEQEIRMSILKKGYCPCTSPPQVLSGHEHGGKIWIFSHPMYVIYIGPQALQSVIQCKLTILVIIHQGLFSLNCKRTFHIANMHDIMFIKFREQTTLRFGQGSL